jgi:hypothetical protein
MEMEFYSYFQNLFQLSGISGIFISVVRRRSKNSHKTNEHILAEARKIGKY